METKKEKYYTIMVQTDKAGEVERGFLNKDTMTPMGKTEKFTMQVGEVALPNFSTIWGKLDRKNNVLTGLYTPMEWGSEGGSPISLRYLKSSPSLSIQYQLEVMKFTDEKWKAMNDGTDIALAVGLNEFDVAKDPKMVEMLKHHYMNEDCPYRNKEGKTIVFSEYSSTAVVEKSAASIAKRREAEDYIINASEKTDGLSVLASIFSLDVQQLPNFLFTALMDKLNENDGVNAFLDKVYKAKDEIHNMLLDAEQSEALKGGEGKEITVANGKGGTHVPLFKDTRIQKGEDSVVKYLLEKVLDPEYFEALKEVRAALRRQKEAVLN